MCERLKYKLVNYIESTYSINMHGKTHQMSNLMHIWQDSKTHEMAQIYI